MTDGKGLRTHLRKFWRYSLMYGLPRTYTKAVGRSRLDSNAVSRLMRVIRPLYLRRKPGVALVGCGQFAFSTIAWFLSRGWTNHLLCCYDPVPGKAESLARYYGIPRVLNDAEELFRQDGLHTAYIASNHASHTDYAVRFLQQGVNVYCEKPISVSFEQFERLRKAIAASDATFYSGYNRPFSGAVRDLKKAFMGRDSSGGRFTINCFVSAEQIPPDHWYRNPGEGTRICGNVGHWIDLMVHCYAWRGRIPRSYKASVSYSDTSEPDDNISISLASDAGDLCTIVITSRSDPFEGINETINFQYGDVIAKIDDYTSLQLWRGEHYRKSTYRPKDVGHRMAIRRPVQGQAGRGRPLEEVFASTEIMLHLAEMVRNTETEKHIQLKGSTG